MCTYTRQTYASVCKVPLAACILIISLLHIIQAACIFSRILPPSLKHMVALRWLSRTEAVIDILDAVTGIVAVATRSTLLAYCAYVGAIVDMCGALVSWNAISIASLVVARTSPSSSEAVAKNVAQFLLGNAVALGLGWWFMLIFWSFYRVIQVSPRRSFR